MNSAHKAELLALVNVLEKKYGLFDVLPKRATSEMKSLEVQVYIQQPFSQSLGDVSQQKITSRKYKK